MLNKIVFYESYFQSFCIEILGCQSNSSDLKSAVPQTRLNVVLGEVSVCNTVESDQIF